MNSSAKEDQALKRPCLDEGGLSTDSADSTSPNKHPTLWMEDGDIILATTSMLFCFYRDVLASHSPIFADMFALPPAQAHPTEKDAGSLRDSVQVFEPLPEVLLPDACDDVEHMLYALHDEKYFVKGQKTSFHKLAGLLRMGTKYEISRLRKDVLAHFSFLFPSELRYMGSFQDLMSRYLRRESRTDGVIVATIHLARECRAEILLPSAFYRLQALDASVYMDRSFEVEGRHYELSFNDLKICVLGSQNIQNSIGAHALDLTYGEEREQLEYACTYHTEVAFGECSFPRSESGWPFNFLYELLQRDALERHREMQNPADLCLGCMSRYKKARAILYEDMWEELPENFDLQDWETLVAIST